MVLALVLTSTTMKVISRTLHYKQIVKLLQKDRYLRRNDGLEHLVGSVVDFSRKGSRLFLHFHGFELSLGTQCGFCVVMLVTAGS
jgi:hypothetical protein